MKAQKSWNRFTVAACLVIGMALRPPEVSAFDTGHHSDLTRSAMQEEGFRDTAIRTAQVENWLVDYYSSTPTAHLDGDLEKLHFDNLYSRAQIGNYWGHLSRNAKAAIQDAARQNDPLKALTLLGASLHAVQDFYTHSTWVETHPRSGDSYRVETWFDDPPAADADLYTGYYPNDPKPAAGRRPHGDYTNPQGVNHDSYGRPRWDEAYVFAYVASRQWIAAMHRWADEADPAFWSRVQGFSLNSDQDRADLASDLNAAYRISEWIALKGSNGHWKGSGSGSTSDFAAIFAAWTDAHDSKFVGEFKTRHDYRPLLTGLVGNDALRSGAQISAPEGDAPAVPTAPHSARAVIVRTLKVEELPVGLFETKIDPLGKPDFYADITVAGQKFVEAMQLDRSSVEPNWTTIAFTSSSAPIPITYDLWDEDGGIRGDDDHCDIAPAGGKAGLSLNLNAQTHACTGDVTGVHDSDGNAVTSEGAKPDKDRARVRFYITARPLASP